jgi:hypothetical protein
MGVRRGLSVSSEPPPSRARPDIVNYRAIGLSAKSIHDCHGVSFSTMHHHTSKRAASVSLASPNATDQCVCVFCVNPIWSASQTLPHLLWVLFCTHQAPLGQPQPRRPVLLSRQSGGTHTLRSCNHNFAVGDRQCNFFKASCNQPYNHTTNHAVRYGLPDASSAAGDRVHALH